MKRLVMAVAAVAAAWGARGETLQGRVVRVADGDTITVVDEAKVQHKVRLDKIDAPEKGQAFGQKSKQQLSAYVFNKSVAVTWAKKDKYGRILGTVESGECGDVNLAMVRDGFAWHYKHFDQTQAYADAEAEARKEKRGLWRDKIPEAPWEFRRRAKERGAKASAAGGDTLDALGDEARRTLADVFGRLERGEAFTEADACSIRRALTVQGAMFQALSIARARDGAGKADTFKFSGTLGDITDEREKEHRATVAAAVEEFVNGRSELREVVRADAAHAFIGEKLNDIALGRLAEYRATLARIEAYAARDDIDAGSRERAAALLERIRPLAAAAQNEFKLYWL